MIRPETHVRMTWKTKSSYSDPHSITVEGRTSDECRASMAAIYEKYFSHYSKHAFELTDVKEWTV
jgi:hypothetical protein